MSIQSVSSAFADISAAFPGESQDTIKLIISVPFLLMIPFTLICGKLSNKVQKKKLLIMSLLIFLLGGLGPCFFNSLMVILAFRALLGIAMGFILPLATSLIADFFQGSERAAMMGWQSSVINIGAIISILIAGFLGTINWHYAFFVYFLGLGVLILIFYKLPEVTIPQKIATRTPLGYQVFLISSLALLYVLFIFTFYTNIALMITKEQLGNSASAGIALSTMTTGGLIAGIFFGRINQLLKKFTVIISSSLSGIAFLMLSYPADYTFILLAAIILGFGFGTTMPWIMTKVANIVPPEGATLALAIVSSSTGLGQFMSPLFFAFLGSLLEGFSERLTFLLAGASIITGSIILLIVFLFPFKMTLKEKEST